MTVKILMPALSPTMTEGNLVSWFKNEGDSVKAGDVIAEIETDKATMEVEAVDEGILGRILVPAGSENVHVNSVIALLLEEGEDGKNLENIEFPSSLPEMTDHSSKTCSTATENQEKESLRLVVSQAISEKEEERLFVTPLARRIAEQNQVNLKEIQGTGPYGRIVKADVEVFLKNRTSSNLFQSSSQPKEAEGFYPAYEEIKLSNMRKIIAKRLTEAKQTIPHFYLTVECQLDELLKIRKSINSLLSEDKRISVNDFVIKACAAALHAVPEANASFHETFIRQYQTVDISVAVAIEGGLVTPIIRQAEHKSLSEISTEMKTLIQKAREGKLKPEEFQGGTFSISNLGMYEVKEFSAIINPPQGAILAVGAGEERPVVQQGQLKVATLMNCTLSVDHRVIDGAVGAQFLKYFKKMMEHPVLMLL